MTFYVFHIPSRTYPKEFTKIQDNFFCFPSKIVNPELGSYCGCLCSLIVSETEEEVKKKLKDFLITLNVFHYEYQSIRWFSAINLKSCITKCESIEEIYCEFKSQNVISGLIFDFNKMPVHTPTMINYSLSFIDVYRKLSALEERSYLYLAFSFLSIIHPTIMNTNRIFENALFENSLQFQLFESIMKQYDTTPEAKEICSECKKVKQRGISRRILDFFELENYRNIGDKQDVIKAVKKIAETRHKFLHALAGKSLMEYYYEDIEPNVGAGATTYLKEDIKYGEGTNQAVWIVKTLNTLILLDKLMEE